MKSDADKQWFEDLTQTQKRRHFDLQRQYADQGVGDNADFKMLECWNRATIDLKKELADPAKKASIDSKYRTKEEPADKLPSKKPKKQKSKR